MGSTPANGSSHDKLGVDGQAARYLRPAALAAREAVAEVFADLLQVEFADQALQLLSLVRLGLARHLQHCGDVVLNAQFPEHRRLLRQIAYAGLRPLVDGVGRDVLVAEVDMPSVGLDEACSHIE